MQHRDGILSDTVGEDTARGEKTAKQRIRTMIFNILITDQQTKLRRRRDYLRAVDEINGLSVRELLDLRADTTDMLSRLKNEYYGERRNIWRDSQVIQWLWTTVMRRSRRAVQPNTTITV